MLCRSVDKKYSEINLDYTRFKFPVLANNSLFSSKSTESLGE
jgi:hypothetical protein